ncbi:helix-turn-helix domain-containing protein [Anoxynatronum buryatiense]|uniref:Homeodomain-like domain-containing protein n=1 Tax=Anoxynatronum buryatiense TaxID=489973 RepID=A0AA45WWA8_9CLOT|nr:helix-turn-helix domain-containing protein [Anoxynatronum buryatiense]SMP57369.1 Homeodomain-like domain-containing protein [Anoxynatronum buryatiense]
MPKVLYVVDLSENERVKLMSIVNKRKTSSKRILHANILLAADINNPNKISAPVIAERYHVHRQTVQTVRKTYATEGLEAALGRKKRKVPPVEPKLTGDVEARIIALCCSDPPSGYERWTLRMVADETIKLEIISSISHMSVGRILKKTNLSLI